MHHNVRTVMAAVMNINYWAMSLVNVHDMKTWFEGDVKEAIYIQTYKPCLKAD